MHSKTRVTSFLKTSFYVFTFVGHFITRFRDLSWNSIFSTLFFYLFLSIFLDILGPCFFALSATQKTSTVWGQRQHSCLNNDLILLINEGFSSIWKGNAQINWYTLQLLFALPDKFAPFIYSEVPLWSNVKISHDLMVLERGIYFYMFSAPESPGSLKMP